MWTSEKEMRRERDFGETLRGLKRVMGKRLDI